MLTHLAIFGVLAVVGLGFLTHVLLHISRLLSHCPDTGMHAHTAGITIASGFAALGLGAIFLIGASLSYIEMVIDSPNNALIIGLGLTAIVLGLGFTNAVHTLRATLLPQQPAQENTNADKAPALPDTSTAPQ